MCTGDLFLHAWSSAVGQPVRPESRDAGIHQLGEPADALTSQPEEKTCVALNGSAPACNKRSYQLKRCRHEQLKPRHTISSCMHNS